MAIKLHEVVEDIKVLTLSEKERVKELTDKMIVEEVREGFRQTADQARIDYSSGKLKGGSAADVVTLVDIGTHDQVY